MTTGTMEYFTTIQIGVQGGRPRTSRGRGGSAGGSAENHIAEVQCMRAGKPVLPRGFVPLYFVPPGCSAEIGVVDYGSARKSVGRSLRKRFGMYAHIHPVPVRAHILMLFLAGRTHRGSARYQSGCKSRVVGE